jgi:hypothetical protein
MSIDLIIMLNFLRIMSFDVIVALNFLNTVR